jgi:AraC-like DNA-binding protein
MQRYTISGRWEGHKTVRPRLIEVTEVCGEYPRTSHHVRNDHWVLDYEFTRHGLCRVGSARAAWQPRLAHTAHLYPPNADYWEDTRAEQGMRHSAWIKFVGADAALLARLVRPHDKCARFLDTHHNLGAILREAALIAQRQGDAGFWLVQGAFARMVDLLLRSRHQGGEAYLLSDAAGADGGGLIQTVDRYLRGHIGEPVALAEVARHAHVGASTLSHRYRAATGRTPMSQFAEMRIGHAKSLLLKGMPLKTVAAQLGFADAFHLSKTFKRIEGVSPREFRQAGR